MTITMNTDPMEMSRDAAKAGGLINSKPGSQQELAARRAEVSEQDQGANLLGARVPPRNPRGVGGYDASPAGPTGATALGGAGTGAAGVGAGGGMGYMGMGGSAQRYNTAGMAENMNQQGAPTAEKLARGILAIGDMAATSINRSSTAVGGAITNYCQTRMDQTPPLSQPLTISKSYINRLSLIQRFTQPSAAAADIVAGYMGELLYWFMTAALAVYHQLVAMKVLPQIAAGAKSDATGVPVNPVSGGLPMARDELAAFKMVGAALLMAYVEVYDALEEAAQLLFRQASTAGQRYLAHRHGGEAADVAAAALAVAADVMTLTLNWFRLMGRAFFSKTATKTARGYLLEHIPDLHLD